MYIITGAAGFIASCVASEMSRAGIGPLVLVDDFSREAKRPNWERIPSQQVDRRDLLGWLQGKESEVEAVIHLGARTDTAETDRALFQELNLGYSQAIWQWCTENAVPLVYASSAATYGEGEWGFEDDHALIPSLKPLNAYGDSKNDFDKWVLQQTEMPPFWAGLKFFNVYGPNEYHKGRMASVIFHAFHQIQANGNLRLFRSHRPDYRDGEQRRDFIYVRDVVAVIRFLLDNQPQSAIYNLGTGESRTFLDLGRAVFTALGREPEIEFVDTPIDIRDKYQYFTEATMAKLRAAGYVDPFWSLEDGVRDYVQNFLVKKTYL